MIDISPHIRMLYLVPSDESIAEWNVAIKRVSKYFSQSHTISIFRWASDLSLAVEVDEGISGTLANHIKTHVRESTTIFDRENHELQMTVCGLLVALQLMYNNRLGARNGFRRDLMAASMWSALSFQPPCSERLLERLRIEVLLKAQKTALTAAARSRRWVDYSSIHSSSTIGSDAPYATETANTDDSGNFLEQILLRDEQIDLLQWKLRDHSRLLDQQLSAHKDPYAIAIASALEVGGLLRFLPMNMHRDLVLDYVDGEAPMNLHELLVALGDDRERLAVAHHDNPIVREYPNVFPLLTALQSGSAMGTNAEIRRPLEEWVGRALLESASIEVAAHL